MDSSGFTINIAQVAISVFFFVVFVLLITYVPFRFARAWRRREEQLDRIERRLNDIDPGGPEGTPPD